jgi:hypothetical protein
VTQLGIPVAVNLDALKRKPSLGRAIEECIELSGLEIKQLPFDKAQLSRWLSEGEGIKWDRLTDLMDACGNDAPVLWMLHKRGFDLSSVRRLETPLEAENRVLRSQLEAAQLLLKGMFNDRR